ncbi:MAG TPA: hypothetical protein VFJ16_24320 [Longimicrobium sp.]|nr:hypothetical protein [Longimicrobium sp.]
MGRRIDERPPFLLRFRTWKWTAAGGLTAVLLWSMTASCTGRHRAPGTCHRTRTTSGQYRAFALIGAIVGFGAALVSNAPVRHRPPVEDDLE